MNYDLVIYDTKGSKYVIDKDLSIEEIVEKINLYVFDKTTNIQIAYLDIIQKNY